MNIGERRRRDAAQDRLLLRFGVVAAIFAATGATALTMAPGEPGLRGLQHLALFAQPSRGRAARPPAPAEPAAEEEDGREAARAAEPAATSGPPRFAAPATPSPRIASAPPRLEDPRSVGAVAGAPAVSARAAATPLSQWRIYDVSGDRALLASPAGIAWAAVGVDLGAAGVVTRIDLRRDGVDVVTSRGVIKRR
jgi:hypothetical protein